MTALYSRLRCQFLNVRLVLFARETRLWVTANLTPIFFSPMSYNCIFKKQDAFHISISTLSRIVTNPTTQRWQCNLLFSSLSGFFFYQSFSPPSPFQPGGVSVWFLKFVFPFQTRREEQILGAVLAYWRLTEEISERAGLVPGGTRKAANPPGNEKEDPSAHRQQLD